MNNSVEKLNDAIEVAEIFWDKYTNKDKDTIRWKLFDTLLELTKTSPELAARKIDQCYFPTNEVTTKLDEKADKKAGFFNGNRLAKEYNLLNERLNEVESMLSKIAIESGKNVIPAIHKNESSGGQSKQASYCIIAKPINEKNIAPHNKTINHPPEKDCIEYYLESTPKLLIWARWIQHLKIEKYRILIAIFTASPYFMGVACIVTFFLMKNGIAQPYGWSLIGFGTIYITVFIMFFRYFITALENNIALLPDWMLPLDLNSAVIQYELNKPGTNKKSLKNIAVKVYAAECPICGHRIIIKSKGFPFSKRLIGECDLNPIEHRYTFDFTTLKGSKLR